jgi:sec-independent protein translocase protein TatC
MTTIARDDDEIEASRAPLIDHLIELRQRLIRALIAFVVMFFACFGFAKYIYNILVWPYVMAGGLARARAARLHPRPRIPLHPDPGRGLRGRLPGLPGDREPDLQVRGAGLYKNERQAFLPYLVATPVCSRSAPWWST